MKILSLILMLFGLCNALSGTQTTPVQSQLEIIVKGIKNGKGNVRAGIFADEKTFLKTAAYGEVVKAKEGELIILIDLPAGTYGVSVIHDENENAELDSGLFGIPKEGFAFGNNAMGSFGPPAFRKASIAVGTGKSSTSITMKYL